jgi:hypothetical protein
MAEGGGLGFDLETGQAIFQRRFEGSLNGHPATKIDVFCEKDLAHASTAENPYDLVFTDFPC